MGVFDQIINEQITLEEAALKLGYEINDLKTNLINYMKAKGDKIPSFLLQEQKKRNRQKISLGETGYVPTFEVQEEEGQERVLPDVASLFKEQFFRAFDLQTQLGNSDNIDQYLQTFRIVQKYIDQMAELELEQKYSHKELFDLVFQFMLKIKEENPHLDEQFITFLEELR